MYRIDTRSASTNLPAPSPPTGIGTQFFSAGDYTTGVDATIVDAEWLNMLQEELCNAIVFSGITLNKADRTQLTTAIRILAGGLVPDLSAYVLKAGDTMTGDLGGTNFYASVQFSGPYVYSSGNITAGATVSGAFVSSSGGINAAGNIATSADVHAANIYADSGNITAAGAVQGTYLYSTGSVGAVGSVTANGAGMSLGPGGQGTMLVFSPGWYWDWNIANGDLQWVTSSGVRTTLGGSGSITAPGAIQGDYLRSTGSAQIDGNMTVASSVFAAYIASSGSIDATGSVYSGPNSVNNGHFYVRQTGSIIVGDDAYGDVTINGVCHAHDFTTTSDARYKTNVSQWSPGLKEVLQINTISYQWDAAANLGEPGKTYYGVSAQDIQTFMPEAVHTMKRTHPPTRDDEGNEIAPEPSDEMLVVNSATLFYACVNAIKELAGEVAALKGAAR